MRHKEFPGELGMENEYRKLNKVISALLNTYSSKILTSPLTMARAFGMPYDPFRYELFEGYFSNYIEGTVFEIEEAKQIIETQMPLPSRNQDSHDILCTYKIVSNRKEMGITPKSPEEFLSLLKYRHNILLSARIDKNPGQFKNKNNFAGQTSFVDLNLVKGTLVKGFELYSALINPFAKAAYMMFIISEIHPFLDGNGRIARIMMNAELVNVNQSKIMIPNVFREDYILSLRKLSRQQDPDPYIRMLSRAHEFTSTIYGNTMNEMQGLLEASNAFLLPDEGKLIITNDNI